MDIFRRLFIVAVLAGLVSGIFATLTHQVATVPVIQEAEVFEKAAEASEAPAAADTTMSMGAEPAAATEHHHDADAWEPADGFERNALTVLADILTGIGFSFLLVAAYAFRGERVDWHKGFCWGLAGFAVFTLAPNLGLPPEVPGTESAPLLDRQMWWLATVILTAGGLALLFLSKQVKPIYYLIAVVMIVAPHAIGAPQPAEFHSAAPESLAHRFIVAVTMTSFLFWVAMGTLTGLFYKRIFKQA
jgi:cobalt transporter subunit CbtA